MAAGTRDADGAAAPSANSRFTALNFKMTFVHKITLNIFCFVFMLLTFGTESFLAIGSGCCQSLPASKFCNAQHHWFEALSMLCKDFFTMPIKLLNLKLHVAD